MSAREIVIPAAKRIKTASPIELSFELPPEYSVAAQQYIDWYESKKGVRTTPAYGAQYRVVFRRPVKPRSTGKHSQNAHLHGHIAQIAEETGNDFEDVKTYIKRQAMGRGYPPKFDEQGDIVYSLNDGYPVPQSERDATVDQAGMLIEEAHILAAELGIILTEDG